MDPGSSETDTTRLASALRRVSQGDRAAFEDVYRQTSVKLFGVCLRILPVRQEAEEALQEAYLSVWRRAASFDATKGSAMTWLITLTRNRAVDRLRSGGKLPFASIDLANNVPDAAPPASVVMETDEDARRLAHCLTTLDDGDGVLIRKAFFEGSTYADLAIRTETDASGGTKLGTMRYVLGASLAVVIAALALLLIPNR